MTKYNPDNIFAKILRGDVPCEKVYEDDLVLAFRDIDPKAPVHILVIPKGAYVSFADFSEHASDEEIVTFFRVVGQLAKEHGLVEPGFRILANHGDHGGQEVPHFHMHLFGGKELGPMLTPAKKKAKK